MDWNSYHTVPTVGSGGDVASGASSSSRAIVSSGATTANETMVLSWLAARNHTVAPGRVGADLLTIPVGDFGVIDSLQARGAVMLQEDELGSTIVALNPGAVDHSVVVSLDKPIRNICVCNAKPLQQWSRLELVIHLQQHEWTPCLCAGDSFTAGGPLVYTTGARPKSYLAALASQLAIFSNGATEILHDAPDGYYKCLLSMGSSALTLMLSDMDGKDNAWFLECGRGDDAVVALEDGVPTEQHVPLASVVPEDLRALGDVGVLVPVVVPVLWQRVIADVVGAGSRPLRIYFDNGTHQSGVQRGWSNCRFDCKCIKYEFVTDDRPRFCARMYLWEKYGAMAANRQDHLRHRPTDLDIAECVAVLRLETF